MKNMLKKSIVVLAVLGMSVFGSAVTGSADDITDSINEALESYKNGDNSAAIQSLNYATQLLMQNKAQSMEAYLPEPLSGWSSDASNSNAVGVSMFGGGVSAERIYSKGTSRVTIQIITDSPMMQGVIMMFSNPMIASSDGGKLEKIGKQKAIVKYDASTREGDIKIIIDNRFFISIQGSDVTKEDLTNYAKKVDYDKVAAVP